MRPATRVALLPFPRGLPRGTYVVAWRVVSADSHPVSGGLLFSVGAPSASVVAPGCAVRAAPSMCSTPWHAGSRSPGSRSRSAGRSWCSPSGPRGRRTGGPGACSGPASARWSQHAPAPAPAGPVRHGRSLADAFSPSLLDFTLSTRFGHALAARLVLDRRLALLLAAAHRGLRGAALAVPATACALGLVATWTLSDHSSTGIQTWLGIPAASVHLLAMALWLGGLAFLVACVFRAAPSRPWLPRFSAGLVFFPALAASGLYLAWRPGRDARRADRDRLRAAAAREEPRSRGDRRPRRALAQGEYQRSEAADALRHSVDRRDAARRRGARRDRRARQPVPARTGYAPPLSLEVPGPAGSALDGATVQVKVKPAKQGDNVADSTSSAATASCCPPTTSRAASARPAAARRAYRRADAGGARALRREPLSVPYRGRWILRLDVDGTAVDAPLQIR